MTPGRSFETHSFAVLLRIRPLSRPHPEERRQRRRVSKGEVAAQNVYKTATNLKRLAMHDIKWIRDNPTEFERRLMRRKPEFKGVADDLIKLDEERRAAITASEQV